MECHDTKIKQLVCMYQLDLLNEEEKIRVEAHLLECKQCFDEIYQMSLILERIEEEADVFRNALTIERSWLSKLFDFITSGINKILNSLSDLRKNPFSIYLIPVTAIALLALFTLLPKTTYDDLAIIKKAPYIAFKGNHNNEVQQLYFDGLEFYRQNKFVEAISKLTEFINKNPNDKNGHFFLGITYLLNNEYEQGITRLEKAIELNSPTENKFFTEKCDWYLANAHLKLNELMLSKKYFLDVINLQGDYQQQAENQIARIQQRKKNQ